MSHSVARHEVGNSEVATSNDHHQPMQPLFEIYPPNDLVSGPDRDQTLENRFFEGLAPRLPLTQPEQPTKVSSLVSLEQGIDKASSFGFLLPALHDYKQRTLVLRECLGGHNHCLLPRT